ncbi:MAG: carbohydrate kinase family protein [Desulfurococcaceae archaeon]
MQKTCDVLLYGDTMLDIVLHLDDQLEFSEVFHVAKNVYISPGGAAANTAVALSRLGITSCLISTTGSDFIGTYFLRDLLGEGVSTKYIKTINGKSGLVISFVTNRNEKVLLSYRGVCYENTISTSGILNDLRKTKLVYVSGYVFNNVDKGSSAVELLRFAHDNKVETFLELDGMPTPNLQVLRELKGFIDFVTMNDQELKIYMETLDVNKALLKLFNLVEPRIVFVKMGEKGSIVYDGYKIIEIPPCNTQVIDPTGCGDAFNAGVIFGLLKGLNPTIAAQLGNAMGAYKAMGHGARFLPRNIIELREFILEHCSFNITIM